MILTLVDCIKENIRTTDQIVRMGGDEFLLIFPDCNLHGVEAIIHRIQDCVMDINRERQPGQVELSFSYGLANIPEHKTSSPAQLIEQADQAMYRHKKSRKARARFETSPIDDLM